MDLRIAPLQAPASLLGESPFWHPEEQVLYWCDIPGHALNRFNPATAQHDQWHFDTDLASCAPMRSGGLLLAMRDGLWQFDTGSGRRTQLAAPPYIPATERFNDGKCDPEGRFWVGTLYEPRDSPKAALYCWDGHSLTRMANGITVSNGLAWSPDGHIQYFSDTHAHTIYAFDRNPTTGSLRQQRVYAQFSLKQSGQDLSLYGGRPDGAAVDVEGHYWVAMFEGQRLLRLSPQGQVIQDIPLPVRCPTMPCFGGSDLKTLYITTSRAKRDPQELAQQPWAGRVLTMQIETAGLPIHLFDG